MNARCRRVVHLAVQELGGLATYTVGSGAQKKIVIRRSESDAE